MNTARPGVQQQSPGEAADSLDRERRFETLGTALSSLRIFLLLSVQFYLLLGFALCFVRPPSGAFYIAVIVLGINTIFLAGCLIRFFSIRKAMIHIANNEEEESAERR